MSDVIRHISERCYQHNICSFNSLLLFVSTTSTFYQLKMELVSFLLLRTHKPSIKWAIFRTCCFFIPFSLSSQLIFHFRVLFLKTLQWMPKTFTMPQAHFMVPTPFSNYIPPNSVSLFFVNSSYRRHRCGAVSMLFCNELSYLQP